MFKGAVYVMPREGILDPQGKAIEGALRKLGYDNVSDTRAGKYFELYIEASSAQDAEALLNEIGRRVLSNPVIESFRCTVTEVRG